MCRYNVIVCHLYVAVSFAAFLFYFSACLAGRSCRSIRSEFIYQTIKRNEHYLNKIRLTFADYKAVTTIEASEAIASLKYPSILFLIPSIFDSTIYESSNSFPILSDTMHSDISFSNHLQLKAHSTIYNHRKGKTCQCVLS